MIKKWALGPIFYLKKHASPNEKNLYFSQIASSYAFSTCSLPANADTNITSVDSGSIKKNRKNPNDPARFIGKIAVTDSGEAANIHNYLDTDKIKQESLYDGLYAVSTDLLDDPVGDILKVSEGRWEIEECFRIMKTDFEARPVFLQNDVRIKAHLKI